MKKILLALFALVSMSAAAQTEQALKFGFLSYEAALKAMPEYAIAQANINELKIKYAAEQKRVEDDFNKKYEEFLDGQKDFPPTILQKRQSELQEQLTKNIAFKKESQRLLANAERETMAPLKERLSGVLAKVATENGLAFVLNTDQDAAPYINPAFGIDLTETVMAALK